MLTADTITDEQIRALRAEQAIDAVTFSTAVVQRWKKSRARCAEILNARTERAS